jgi:hypothetical protein
MKSDQRYKAKEATIENLKLDLTKDAFFCKCYKLKKKLKFVLILQNLLARSFFGFGIFKEPHNNGKDLCWVGTSILVYEISSR